MERMPVGSVQQHIFLWMIEDMLVSRLSERLEERIGRMTSTAYLLRERVSEASSHAENILVSALGINGWSPPEPLSYTSSSANAFASGRLDAQYYAPKIRHLLDRLSLTGSRVGQVSRPRRERFDPSQVVAFDYIEIGDVQAEGIVSSCQIDGADAPSRATWHVRAGDIVTSTVRPIRRLSAQIDESQDGFVCSSGFVVLEPISVASEVLLTYLRLPSICELLDLYASASMYPAVSESDVLGLPFPKIDTKAAEAITEAVKRSRVTHQMACQLLGHAKRVVEIAIEESEQAAWRYLEKAQECEE